MPDGSIMNFSSNVVKNTTGYDVKDLIIGSEGTLMYPDSGNAEASSCTDLHLYPCNAVQES